MVDNLSMGPVQVFSLDLSSINLAFQEVSERVDALKGLRGRAEIFDRARVDDPEVSQDALTLGGVGTASAEERSMRYTLLFSQNLDVEELKRMIEESKRYALLTGTGI